MTTVAQMVDRILLSMQGTTGPGPIDVLSGAVDAVQTVASNTNETKAIRAGATLEIDEELMTVISVSGATLVLARGQFGTTATAHADDAIIYINPRHSRHAIIQNMEEEIRSWPNEVFKVENETVTVSDSDGVLAYNFLTEVTAPDYLHTLRIDRTAPTNSVSRIGRDRSARIIRGLNTGTYPSGLVLQLTGKLPGFTEYNVVYASKYDLSTFTSATDLETDVGIPASMLDIIEYGVMGRMLIGKETRRIQRSAQGQPREGQEVREGVTFQTAAGYQRMAKDRLGEEARRLRHEWPIRIN